jgi:hypothetical protein
MPLDLDRKQNEYSEMTGVVRDTYHVLNIFLMDLFWHRHLPARASGRKGEDGEGVDAAMVLATAPTVRRVLMVRAREMLRAENTREAESWWIVSTYKPVSYIHEIRSAYDVCVSHILSTHRGIR